MNKIFTRMKNIIVEQFNAEHISKIGPHDIYLENANYSDGNTTCVFSLLVQSSRSIIYEVTYYRKYPHYEVKIFEVQKMFIEY